MCDWKYIARPKIYGGWGLWNILDFSKSMVANSIQGALMKEGLWNRVIKDKYMPFVSTANWIRTMDITKEKGSKVWKYLLNSLHLLLHWLAWSPGNGHSILIGKDYILGIGQSAILLEELIEVINIKGIYYLSQAKEMSQVGHITSNWISSDDLELSGRLQVEWKAFCVALINNKITKMDWG